MNNKKYVWVDGKKENQYIYIYIYINLAVIKFGGWRISLNLADAEKT